MKKIILNDKYPIFITEILKKQTSFNTAEEILEFFKRKIKKHPFCSYIGDFNHLIHTKSINGEIDPEMTNCILVTFCIGKKLLSAEITAVKPRTIGINEYKDKFKIAFLEAPASFPNETMIKWINELKTKD